MKSFELLGGKYQQGEQILPGVIQTFRSYEVSTGRPVFIHRIPTNDPAAPAIAGLLSAGLIRSPIVRKMLLDVYEREQYRFIVTEPARQCVPLRDWLEHETGETAEPEAEPADEVQRVEPEPVIAEEPVEREPLTLPVQLREATPMEPSPDADTSEFARLFQEALSGKLERSKRNALQEKVPPLAEAPASKPVAQTPAPPPMTLVPREPVPVPSPAQRGSTPAPQPSGEPEMFSQAAEAEAAGRSNLIIVLVVLGVLVLLLVMFVLIFLKR